MMMMLWSLIPSKIGSYDNMDFRWSLDLHRPWLGTLPISFMSVKGKAVPILVLLARIEAVACWKNP